MSPSSAINSILVSFYLFIVSETSLVRSTAVPCWFIFIYIYIYISVRQFGPMGAMCNLIGSLKFNTMMSIHNTQCNQNEVALYKTACVELAVARSML